MMVFSTRCCGRLDGLAVLAALLLALAWPPVAQAEGIEVRRASVNVFEDGYVLEAEFGVTLTPALEDALNKGVALYFVLDFELVRPRWYWFNEKLADVQLQYRLSYNALTRQYRIGVGNLYQNFRALSDALEFMSRVRRREDLAAGALKKDAVYTAALRLRLDTAQLPRPFQLSAFGSRDWNLSSEWHRWTVSP